MRLLKKKILDVVIPKGATVEQVEMIQKAVQYGADKGVNVQINVVK
jgi:hypothetical protein